MTENEVIKYIKNMAFMCEKHEKCEYGNQCTTKCLNATKIAIKALEEIQQYRAIGTVEEFKSLKECFGHTTPKSRGKAIYDKAIDKFTEKLKSDEFQKYNLDMVFETSRDLSYTNCISAFCEYIDEMAKQMKGE